MQERYVFQPSALYGSRDARVRFWELKGRIFLGKTQERLTHRVLRSDMQQLWKPYQQLEILFKDAYLERIWIVDWWYP